MKNNATSKTASLNRPKAVLSNRLYVRESDVDDKILRQFRYKFSERVFDEFLGEHVIVEREHAAYKRNQERGLIGFQRGNLLKIRDLFGDFEIVDKTVAPPLGFKLKRRFKLRPEQKEVIDEWLRHGCGIMKAPVRWGKTIACIYLATVLGTRVLILTDKEQLYRQWLKEFRKFTNITKLEKKLGRPLIGLFTGSKAKEFFPITVTTFQTLWSRQRRQRFLSKNRDYFGFVAIDEAQHTPADTFGAVASSFSAKYRCGVTATPKRRDQKHHLLYDIVGPIVGHGRTEQLPCNVIKHQTGVMIDPKASWGWMQTLLTKSQDFNELVVAQIIKDVHAGRFVLVHTERTAHCHELAEMIQDLDMSIKVGIAHGKIKVKEREHLIKLMNDGKVQVIIGAKVIQEGLTFKRADCIHIGFSPTVNPDNWEQITGRVRTPMPEANKPKPIVHDWRVRGHGGVYASGRARDKLYGKMKWEVEETLAGVGFGGDDNSDGLPPVPRFCGNCKFFFECKGDIETNPKDEPCRSKEHKWDPIRLNPRAKLQFIKVRIRRVGEFSQKFVDSLSTQNYEFWSRKQLGILNRIFEEVQKHPSVWVTPELFSRYGTTNDQNSTDETK